MKHRYYITEDLFNLIAQKEKQNFDALYNPIPYFLAIRYGTCLERRCKRFKTTYVYGTKEEKSKRLFGSIVEIEGWKEPVIDFSYFQGFGMEYGMQGKLLVFGAIILILINILIRIGR